ncbi:hypothetical protein [Microbacterium immunditiarum]|uniref:Uncharacterized protein n=1 Tax=Microbacterium immunditiarum TaxID=337480 RepID=A0A7Y9GKC4_9MICO|nr:hypothetical protein [Microbacterium immunditiarum]NYE18057.1 hypothetical protein [Microbacterium immunditiarum]
MPKVDLADKLSAARARVDAELPEFVDAEAPMFARLTRKETRLREDQYAELSALARSLMRRRRVKGERITENTLIRVAVDLLLARRDELRGSDEDELRKSVTHGVAELQTPVAQQSRSDGLRQSGTPVVCDSDSPAPRLFAPLALAGSPVPTIGVVS